MNQKVEQAQKKAKDLAIERLILAYLEGDVDYINEQEDIVNFLLGRQAEEEK